jgi:hypothetical protein
MDKPIALVANGNTFSPGGYPAVAPVALRSYQQTDPTRI